MKTLGIKKLKDTIKNEINSFVKYVNSNKNITKVIDKAKYFIYNFRYAIFLLVGLIIFLKINGIYKRNFSTSRISYFIDNSKFANNAIAINGHNFLTTYNSIKKACQVRNSSDKLRFFLVSSDKIFEVYIKNYSEYMDLAILTMTDEYARVVDVDNFVVFPRVVNVNKNDDVYVSKTINDVRYKYKKFKLKENKKDYVKYVDLDRIRQNTGEVVLSDKLEFSGITSDNVKDSGFKLFKKKIEVITPDIVKPYLRSNNVGYYVNMDNADLYSLTNYTNRINYKLVCRTETKVVPRVFKVYR
ncbi:MAG: hypothetical protein IJ853_02865 [Rickettsiales bacterium]|nr:hypothetical protein [Rickettsiales bacterium]